MESNLDKIALDLYDKIQTKFPDVEMGDEHGDVLSKKEDIPNARFFEFEYKENDKVLGTIAITLDADDGVVVQISREIVDSKHHGAYKFIRGFRRFAKDRLLNFDIKNIGKSNLDKRDYAFQAKAKEEPMNPIMENKMFGTSRMSYQDLGEARLVVKHSQAVNPDLPAGRTMHIEAIYIENASGERFRYPHKHLNGARALAEHIKAGGNPYDSIGKHITSLSEELAQLRKFKGYVGRNANLAEAMGGITDVVSERIETIKKQVGMLQRPAYYAEFAESFEAHEDEMIPEEIMSDLIDRLTIRTFNEDLKSAFPYIFRLVDESELPVRSLSPDDLLDEAGSPAQQAAIAINMKKNHKKPKNMSEDPEDQFESFLDRILGEDEESQEGRNTLFSKNIEVRGHALQNLKDILAPGLPAGQGGLTASQSLKGIIDSDTFTKEYLSRLSGNDDAGIAVKMYLGDLADDEINEPLAPHAGEIAKELIAANELNFDKESETPVGGEEVPPEAAAPAAPPPEAAQAPAPDMAAGAPPAEAGAMPPDMAAGAPPAEAGAMPPAAPVAESTDDLPWDTDGDEEKHQFKKPHNPNRTGRDTAKALSHAGLLKAIHKAKEAGAKLDTKLDFGHKEMTLHDCIRECGMDPAEFGFEQSHDPVNDILKAIAGFWNKENKNFTIGGTRAKIKVIKDFKNGEFKGAEPHHIKHVVALIDKMDPSEQHQEIGHIRKLAGVNGQVPSMEIEMGEGSAQEDLAAVAKAHPELAPIIQKIMNDPNAKYSHSSSTTSSGNTQQMPKVSFGDQEFDFNNPDDMGNKIKSMVSGQLGKMDLPKGSQQLPGGMGSFDMGKMRDFIQSQMNNKD